MADRNAIPAVAAIESDRGANRKEPCCVHTKKIYDACREEVCAGYKNIDNRPPLCHH